MSPAGRGSRLPGEAPQPFCERCGRSVDAATIGLRVGLCHCPSCDIFACRSCWSEAAESCPECGTSFAAASTAEMHSEALAAGALAANALRGENEPPARLEEPDALAEDPTAWAEVTGAWAGVPTEPPATIASPPLATGRWTTLGLPIGFGFALIAAALLALVFANPFGAGGVESAINPTSSPTGSLRVGGAAGVGTPSPGAEGTPIVDGPTDPTDPTATGPISQPPNGPVQTPQPTAAVTPGPGATATPTPRPREPGTTPTPKPPATPAATPTPTPTPTPSPAPTPTPEPPPACRDVPNLVGLTVAKARGTWKGAGFTGAFTAPDGPGNQIVATQSQPAGACLPPGTSVTVTTV